MGFRYLVCVVWKDPAVQAPNTLYWCRDRTHWLRTIEYLQCMCGSLANVIARRLFPFEEACGIWYATELAGPDGVIVEMFPDLKQLHKLQEAQEYIQQRRDVVCFTSIACEHKEADILYCLADEVADV